MSGSSPAAASPRNRGWAILLGVVLSLLLLAIGVYFLVGGVAAHMLTQPQRKFDPSQTPTTRDLPYQDVQFPARNDGVPIAAWFIPTAADQPVVIMVHGRDASRTAAMAGHELDLAKALHDAGLNVLLLDLRGHGASGEGRFTFGIKERQDVLGAVDWLSTQGFAPEQTGIFGISLGAAASIGAMVAEPRLGALAIDSGFADINTLVGEQWESASGLPRPFLTAALMVSRLLTGVDITQAKPVAEIASLASRPLLLIHCEADDYVPARNTAELAAAAPWAQVWLIPDAGCKHAEGYVTAPEEYATKVAAFFEASLR